jgi:hypothetical protein
LDELAYATRKEDMSYVGYRVTHVKFKRKRKSCVSSDRSMSPTSGPRGITSSSASAMANLQLPKSRVCGGK